jgi:hypothetical protein
MTPRTMLPAGIGAAVPMTTGSLTTPVHVSPGWAVSEEIWASIVTLMGVPSGTVTPGFEGFGAGAVRGGLLLGLGVGVGVCPAAGGWYSVCGVMSPEAGSLGFEASRLSLLDSAAWSAFLAPHPASSAATARTLHIMSKILRIAITPSGPPASGPAPSSPGVMPGASMVCVAGGSQATR